MFDGKITCTALIFLSLWASSRNAAFAQDEDPAAARIRASQEEAQRRAQELRAAEEAKRQRDLSIMMLNDLLIDGRSQTASAVSAAEAQRAKERGIQLARLRSAFTVFEAARKELSEALGFKAKLRDPARKMEKSAAVFHDFLKGRNKERAQFDPSEFKEFSATELGWEALTSAERVSPHLAAVIRSESEAIVDVRFLMSLSKLQAELLRLQWMTQRLK